MDGRMREDKENSIWWTTEQQKELLTGNQVLQRPLVNW